MSDKTEDPTPKRLRDAKKKGQVANSKDMTTAFLFIAAFGTLLATGGMMMDTLKEHMRTYILWSVSDKAYLPATYEGLGSDVIFMLLKVIAPIMGAIFVIAIGISYAQVGGIFTFEPMKPDLKKLNPLSGIKKWFSPKTLVELIKSVIKMGIVAFLAYKIVADMIRPLVLSVGSDIGSITIFLQDAIKSFTVRVAVIFVLVGAADFFYQKKQHIKQLKMSKDEVKREYKEDEGDPMFKHKRKELAHELVFNNMMKNARKATAVVVNPTHYAAAVLYDKAKGGAPRVVAKGQNLIAEQLKKIAKEEKIPIVRNISLAQALNKVEVGEEIPEELYQAVAEVLNFVYRLGQHGRKR